jgi:hypothetical protein
MIQFTQYLTESLDVEKLKHLEHLEDHIIHGGHEGVAHASETLSDVVAALEGKPRKNFNLSTKITTKYDGSPSIVFGTDPRTGRFFVGTKSVFNEKPKAAYTDSDIEQMYGHAPGLVQKLKVALRELPKIMPKTGGIFQGDLMYEKGDLKDDGKTFTFTPNTISYSADVDSAMGRQIAAANLGIVVHTKYTGKTFEDMKASFDVDQTAFQKDPLVHMINPEVTSANIAPIEKKQYEAEIQQATDLYSQMPEDVFNVVDGHDVLIKTYINQCIKDKTVPTAKGYLGFIKARNKKEIEKKKSPDGKAKAREKGAVIEDHVKNHMDTIDAVFKMHGHLQRAKNALVNALSRVETGFKTTIGGKPTKPEGFVAIRGGRPTKLVDRAEFSAANFAMGAFRKGSKEEQAAAEDLNPVVTSFARMNPPTYYGHGAVVSKVKELADEMKAKSVIALSRSQDPEKNPLTPEQKLKHAKRMFPDANIVIADEDAKDMMSHIKKLAGKGHKHLVLVVGSDRVEEMRKLLDRYKDQFGFKKVDVVSSGDRDMESDKEEEPGAKKPETEEDIRRGMSASKMRGHAIRGQYKDFRHGFHPDTPEEVTREMYDEVRKGMDIKIDASTPIRALVNHAKRKDPIGVKARRELERRHKAGEMEETRQKAIRAAKRPVKAPPKAATKAPAPTVAKKPAGLKSAQRNPVRVKTPSKSIREEMTTGDIRGMGYVTGNPLVDAGFQTVWTAMNQADADTKDQIMNQTKKSLHDDLHANIEARRESMKQNFIRSVVSSINRK